MGTEDYGKHLFPFGFYFYVPGRSLVLCGSQRGQTAPQFLFLASLAFGHKIPLALALAPSDSS